MQVFAQWYGGCSYVWGDDDDIERFDSIAAAKVALDNRHSLGYSFRQHFEFVNREPESSFCPVVGEDSELWLFFADPTGDGDKYPDRIVKFGPRGGVITERT
jgi:hypothetical protein